MSTYVILLLKKKILQNQTLLFLKIHEIIFIVIILKHC